MTERKFCHFFTDFEKIQYKKSIYAILVAIEGGTEKFVISASLFRGTGRQKRKDEGAFCARFRRDRYINFWR